MAEVPQFSTGDAVIHPRRPEWGEGIVTKATRIEQEGQTAQRLLVRFANHHDVTINTAIAQLLAKETYETMRHNNSGFRAAEPGPRPRTEGGWLGSLSQSDHAHELWQLPENMTDPFRGEDERLKATLESFRFSTESRSLMSWATTQTGLDDPLSTYTRQELEQAFPRFARDRDAHLVDLVRLFKRQGLADVLKRAMSDKLVPSARQALQRAMRG